MNYRSRARLPKGVQAIQPERTMGQFIDAQAYWQYVRGLEFLALSRVADEWAAMAQQWRKVGVSVREIAQRLAKLSGPPGSPLQLVHMALGRKLDDKGVSDITYGLIAEAGHG